MSVRLIPLASSSKANATAIVAGGKVIVVDAGISRLTTLSMLAELDVLTQQKKFPDALLLTHDHGDHARYADQWTKGTAEIYATCGTANVLKIADSTNWRVARPFETRKIGPVSVTPIPVSHDAAEPVAWRVAYGGVAAVVATDLGLIPSNFHLFCEGATDLLLEANYHMTLLAACDYIQATKERIASDLGHLDLEVVCRWIKDEMPESVERLWLGHVSTKTCLVKLVRMMARKALGSRKVKLTVLDK